MDFEGLMEKAKAVQDSMAGMRDKMGDIKVQGEAGGGLVAVVLNANNLAKEVKIDASLVKDEQDRVMLQDLLVAAFNNAREKAEKTAQEELAKLSKSLGLPDGFGL